MQLNSQYNRYEHTFFYIKESLFFLVRHKQMLILTILSWLCACIVCGIEIGLVIQTVNKVHFIETWLKLIILCCFSLYLSVSFIIAYFNAALIHLVLKKMQGERTTIREAFRVSNKNLFHLLKWSIAGNGLVLIVLCKSNKGSFDAFLRNIITLTGNLLAFFVLPIMVVENVNPTQAIQLAVNFWGLDSRIKINIFTIVASVSVIFIISIYNLFSHAFGLSMLTMGNFLMIGILFAITIASTLENIS